MEIKNIRKLQNGSDVRGVAMRGIEGEEVTFTQDIAMKIAYSFARWLAQKTGKSDLKFAIGRDSRLTGEHLSQAVALGLVSRGATVFQCGLATTPSMFIATIDESLKVDGAIMVTASHLPFNRNGLKFFDRQGGLNKEDITVILEVAETIETDFTPGGQVSDFDFLPIYAKRIVRQIQDQTGSQRPLSGSRILVDAGNGAGGFFTDQVLKPLGADTTGSQYLDPDGSFPNHVPNPEDPQAILDVSQAVTTHQADLGIIFDTDVDRAAVIDERGQPINRNAFIALMAQLVLEKHPGTTIVTDSVTSTGLTDYIEALGGKHHRFKRGYRNVINEAIRLDDGGVESHLAIETSGHGAIKENYFLDDGAYLVTMVLIKFAQLLTAKKPISTFLKDLKEPLEARELRLRITSDDFKTEGQRVLTAFEEFASGMPGWSIVSPNYEGVRINCDQNSGDGWCLLRLSLHDPILPLNIESNVSGGCDLIEGAILDFLKDFESVSV